MPVSVELLDEEEGRRIVEEAVDMCMQVPYNEDPASDSRKFMHALHKVARFAWTQSLEGYSYGVDAKILTRLCGDLGDDADGRTLECFPQCIIQDQRITPDFMTKLLLPMSYPLPDTTFQHGPSDATHGFSVESKPMPSVMTHDPSVPSPSSDRSMAADSPTSQDVFPALTLPLDNSEASSSPHDEDPPSPSSDNRSIAADSPMSQDVFTASTPPLNNSEASSPPEEGPPQEDQEVWSRYLSWNIGPAPRVIRRSIWDHLPQLEEQAALLLEGESAGCVYTHILRQGGYFSVLDFTKIDIPPPEEPSPPPEKPSPPPEEPSPPPEEPSPPPKVPSPPPKAPSTPPRRPKKRKRKDSPEASAGVDKPAHKFDKFVDSTGTADPKKVDITECYKLIEGPSPIEDTPSVQVTIRTLGHPLFFDLQSPTFRLNPRFLAELYEITTRLGLELPKEDSVFYLPTEDRQRLLAQDDEMLYNYKAMAWYRAHVEYDDLQAYKAIYDKSPPTVLRGQGRSWTTGGLPSTPTPLRTRSTAPSETSDTSA